MSTKRRCSKILKFSLCAELVESDRNFCNVVSSMEIFSQCSDLCNGVRERSGCANGLFGEEVKLKGWEPEKGASKLSKKGIGGTFVGKRNRQSEGKQIAGKAHCCFSWQVVAPMWWRYKIQKW